MPHPRVGWRNTGNLTKSSVKFSTTGAKKLVKIPLCSHLDRGVSIGDLIYLLKVQQTAAVKNPASVGEEPLGGY